MYPGLPHFLCSQVPCDDSWGRLGAVALYPVQGGGSGPDSDTGAGCSPGAEQPGSCKDGCQPPSCPHRVPLLCHAAPHGLPFPRVCIGWEGLVWGGAKGAWQRLCSGGAWRLTAWYLLGRQGTEAKVAVPVPAFPLALYRRAPKCRWCRRAGRCVSRQRMGGGDRVRTHPRLRLSIPVRQCGESSPPVPRRADNESAGLCLRRGSGHNGQRA